MFWAFKMFFKIIGYIFVYTFSFVIALVLLPFYGIFTLCGGKLPKAKKTKKRKCLNNDHFEWAAGYLWD